MSHRISRFVVPEEPEDLSDKYKDFKFDSYASCFELRATFNANVVKDNRVSLNVSAHSQIFGPSTSFNLPVGNNATAVPVYKWGLTSDGTTSVKAFLERVNELAISRGVSEDQLFYSGFDLFQGAALSWYRANRDSFLSWSDLVEALKRDFLPLFYDESLLEQIKVRFQGRQE